VRVAGETELWYHTETVSPRRAGGRATLKYRSDAPGRLRTPGQRSKPLLGPKEGYEMAKDKDKKGKKDKKDKKDKKA
jgi:hypothetical protein